MLMTEEEMDEQLELYQEMTELEDQRRREGMKIVQINETEVIDKLCEDKNVLRLKVEDYSICNLQDKTIKTIKRDMQKEDVYLYFVLVD